MRPSQDFIISPEKKANESNKRDNLLVRSPQMNRIPFKEETDKRDETESTAD
jgi:hypothetical protein